MSLKDEIIILRDKLNESISEKENFDTIYNLSTRLDDLITLYYRDYRVDNDPWGRNIRVS